MISIELWMPVALGLIVLFFWMLKEVKNFLFWTYLWQLKNYHIGRFLAHFNTYNGKRIFISKLSFVKYLIFAILLIMILYSNDFIVAPFNEYIAQYSLYFSLSVPLLFLIYILEGISAFISLVRKKAKAPELTSKTSILLPLVFVPLGIIVALFAMILINDLNNPSELIIYNLISFAFSILAFDILTPLLVSFVVLLFQPITVLMRWRIIRKAMKKRKLMENLLVIGVTGSYGKSSTKEFLKAILFGEFKVLATEKNENSEIGISSLILQKLKEDHEIFICEMGAYNRGGIKLLCDIVKPKIGVLTGINNQHLATFGSQKNIIKTKFELIDSLPEEGLAVLNWDNDFIKDNFDSKVNNIKYALSEEQDIWAEDIKENKYSISFKVVTSIGESCDFKANVLGSYNIPNILAAVTIARRLGMSLEDIAEKVKSAELGIQVKKGDWGLNIINATYSSNFNGIISHLEYLKNWEGRKVLVMPCLIELGFDGKETHRKIGRKIGEVCDLAIITSKDYFKEIFNGAVESNMKKDKILFMEDSDKIFQKLSVCARDGDIVLLESRVPNGLINKLLKNV
ncbi:MAG: UDP-N-acetylmuramoyl-tripeptide--D-alanyl-D-alanine ligase [Candidatus Pacebacteria bacterium]|nr:UDP-N-acetylmuramoyl-tripeptide--D-alanyl-D-alanine ligase [Candidatus Paceibacterota bacterium]